MNDRILEEILKNALDMIYKLHIISVPNYGKTLNKYLLTILNTNTFGSYFKLFYKYFTL